MRKIFIACIFFTGMYNPVQAQSQPLNKQQTVDYIEKLYKSTFQYKDDYSVKVVSVTLDGKILQRTFSNGTKGRIDITVSDFLEIINSKTGYGFNISYSLDKTILLNHIVLEADAKRLKKALEHLIELLKSEKSTDPFDN